MANGESDEDINSSIDTKLIKILPRLEDFAAQLSISHETEIIAFQILKEALTEYPTQRSNILLIVSVFAAMQAEGIPNAIDRIMTCVTLSKNIILKRYRILVNDIFPRLDLRIRHLKPQHYAEEFSQALNLSKTTTRLAIAILDEAEKNRLPIMSKDPRGLAAAAVYLASKYKDELRTQDEICLIANITGVTLRMRAKELKVFSFYRGTIPPKISEKSDDQDDDWDEDSGN